MNFEAYQQEATSTFKVQGELNGKDSRLCDWALGISSEAGEVAGLIKHGIFHKTGINKMKVAKEVGDVLWYLSALCTTLGIDLGDCAHLNLLKLKHRHGVKFSYEGSANRHEKEQQLEDTELFKVLEGRINNEK